MSRAIWSHPVRVTNTSVWMTCFSCGHVESQSYANKEAALAKIRSFPDAYMRRHGEHGDATVHS
jgi:hypothetical protein